ncbi:unnamed protein product [Soboliphyme baturini]|uniref:Uncharacterized protein n=1 Tax=Soboliphyme baturini TaxID=241478 RepID=A0A183IF76_9BILA|nr:unnamed protein product [Soboliphyme baturini]
MKIDKMKRYQSGKESLPVMNGGRQRDVDKEKAPWERHYHWELTVRKWNVFTQREKSRNTLMRPQGNNSRQLDFR